ncbi:MAG TPA: hypothetical protein VJ440_14390 [Candidatus Brocadiaceae bacterium]|nr:hypothetical protein [Candidatus Brocadiaceae bacterium]
MEKRILFYIIFLCFIASNIFAANSLEDKLKNIQKQKDQRQKTVIDDSLRKEIYYFLTKNENVSVKDFKNYRIAIFASDIVIEDLDKKYGSIVKDYQVKIKNEKDKKVYRIALKIRTKRFYRDFYACKGDDEQEVKEGWGKVDAVRSTISELLKKNKSLENSDEAIKLYEQILEECKYHSATNWLLTAYRVRGEKDDKFRKKFNELMLRMLNEDQVDYDYLYYPVEKLNTGFVINYLLFFTNVNSLKDKLILSKEQVKFIAEDMLTKHQEMFNFRNRYYSPEDGSVNEYGRRDGVQALVNVSIWLREYKLDELNDRLIDRFFTDEEILKVVKYDDQFKDFRDYLK